MSDSKLPGIDWESTGIKVIENGDKKQVMVGGRSYFRWNNSDESGQRLAIVQLCELALGTQEEVAKIFGVHVNSVSNYLNSFRADGIRGLIDQPRGPKQSWKVVPQLKSEILRILLLERMNTYQGIQERLEKKGQKVSIGSIRQVLIENGFVKERVEIEDLQVDLFEGLEEKGDSRQEEFSFPEEVRDEQIEEMISEKIKDPAPKYSESRESRDKRRSGYSRPQRMYFDQLEQGIYNSYAGGLLFVPLLQQYNFLKTIKR